ncbi:uncharacterized protein LY79DRAFT_357987 [Colletotrichum navitas]|uniref:Uncharacterized protein n=1 Tax=Colletotrichum navitas TaxID=681940 RepID=A0AAD8PRA1_9PEZI|nr:uncharacterized protein LY79DRAFT_357987 [Colletotrichum navitas]KAK1579175.1 hypothetical protein LY79DRAFT_357987 [Colletotrichum navitas]
MHQKGIGPGKPTRSSPRLRNRTSDRRPNKAGLAEASVWNIGRRGAGEGDEEEGATTTVTNRLHRELGGHRSPVRSAIRREAGAPATLCFDRKKGPAAIKARSTADTHTHHAWRLTRTQHSPLHLPDRGPFLSFYPAVVRHSIKGRQCCCSSLPFST